MGNIRIHELAKEIGVDSKTVMETLKSKGIEKSSSSSSIDEAQANEIRSSFAAKKNAAEAGRKAETKASAETKSAGEEGAEKPKKKKKYIAVFHPQNATSKEGKNFSMQGGKNKNEKNSRNDKGPRRDRRSEEQADSADRNRRGVVQESRGGKPVGTRSASGTPLVHVPRPHAIVRTPESLKPAPQPAPKKKVPEAETAPQTAAETPVPEQKIPETPAAETRAAAPKTENRTPAANPAADTAAKAAQTDGNAASNITAERPAQDRGNSERGSGQRNNYGDRGNGDRSNGGSGQRSYGDRNNGGNGQRSYGDRSNGGNGQRSYGDRNNGGNGQRSYGDRNNGNAQGRKPFGDRNNRPGQGQGRPSFGDRKQGGFVRSGKDEDENSTNRFGSHGRPQHNDHKGAAPSMDMGVKKTSRDGAHNKDKDKNKENLRGNKYTNDRSSSTGRGGHNKQLIPKALQKPTHKRDEKKEEKVTEIKVPEKLTIKELAELMKMQPSVIVKDLFMKGEMFTVNQEVDYEKAEEIAMTYEILCEPEEKVDVIAEMLKEDEEDEAVMVSRPPVVCVMGHVDHGKTSLLDAIRHAHVTDREAGGITQNIGAYGVTIDDRRITFLDTPGHEAFTAMRLRGAKSTDIAVLVVAADDGVMPQTIEAINHAKAAGIEIIVAINKIDKPGANVDRVKQELSEYELIPTDWGGSTEMVEVSAKTKLGIDDLLETILLTADIMELKANPDRLARGLVLEAKLDKGKGPVANLLVQKGTLRVGDYIACGSASGKVRAMTDENGRRVKVAGPSTPVEVQGLNGVPDAGETLVAMETDKEAKNFAATYVAEHKNQLLEETKSRMSLDALFGQIQDGSVKELEVILKADVQGSVEALKQSLLKLSNEEVVIKIIHGGVGAINESDITLAAASNAIVIGFNVRPDQTAKNLADEEKVDVRLYRVIYQAIDDIEAAMKGMLEPIYEEKVIGHAEIRQLFKASGVGTIAGSYVLDGFLQRGCKARITRGKDQLFDGNVASLKRFKDDVKEVKAGYECGLVFEGFNDVQEGDLVEAYAMVEVPR